MAALSITNAEKRVNFSSLPDYFSPYLLDWTSKELYAAHSSSILLQYFGSTQFYYSNLATYTQQHHANTIQLNNPSRHIIIQLYTACDSLPWQYNNIKTQKIIFTSLSEFNVSLSKGNLLHLFTLEKSFLEQLIGKNVSVEALVYQLKTEDYRDTTWMEVPDELSSHKLISSKLSMLLHPGLDSTLLRLKMLSLVIDIISLCSRAEQADKAAKPQTAVDNILGEIKERIIQKPNIKDFHYSRLAKEYLSNRSTLSRGFKTAYGITLTQFLHSQVMNKAKQLLVETDMSVNEISDYLGYNQATNFSRNFYKQFRQQPHEFRK